MARRKALRCLPALARPVTADARGASAGGSPHPEVLRLPFQITRVHRVAGLTVRGHL